MIRAFKEFKRSVNAYREKLTPLITQSLSDDAHAELKAGHDDLEEALHNLMESCHGWFLKAAGSVPTD